MESEPTTSESAGAADEEMIAFRVHGRVQGVGFRWWTHRVASRLGLGGHVRNLPDGSVEVHATGARSGLAELEAALRHGPPGSRVDSLVAIAPAAEMSKHEFRIEIF